MNDGLIPNPSSVPNPLHLVIEALVHQLVYRSSTNDNWSLSSAMVPLSLLAR